MNKYKIIATKEGGERREICRVFKPDAVSIINWDEVMQDLEDSLNN